jgi:hypothetical protein
MTFLATGPLLTPRSTPANLTTTVLTILLAFLVLVLFLSQIGNFTFLGYFILR